MTALSRRQVLGAAAAAGLGAVVGPGGVVAAAEHGPRAEYVSFLHPATADFAPGSLVAFGPDGVLGLAQQGFRDGWFYSLIGVRAPGRAVRRHGQLLLPVAVAGVVDVLVVARDGHAVGYPDLLYSTAEAGLAASRGFIYLQVGRALSPIPAGSTGLVRTLLKINHI
jgi:hypothetical protein